MLNPNVGLDGKPIMETEPIEEMKKVFNNIEF